MLVGDTLDKSQWIVETVVYVNRESRLRHPHRRLLQEGFKHPHPMMGH